MLIKKLRFVTKFINGAWVVFDNVQYRNVALRDTQRAAVRETDKRNSFYNRNYYGALA